MKGVINKHWKKKNQQVSSPKNKENIISLQAKIVREKIKTSLSILNIFNFPLVQKARVSKTTVKLYRSRAALNAKPLHFSISAQQAGALGKSVGGRRGPQKGQQQVKGEVCTDGNDYAQEGQHGGGHINKKNSQEEDRGFQCKSS